MGLVTVVVGPKSLSLQLRAGHVQCCRMIDGGQVFARIDEAAGMVRFLEDPERYDTARVVQRIDGQIQQSIAISGRLMDINQRVRLASLCCVALLVGKITLHGV